jgi:hypothetical protein
MQTKGMKEDECKMGQRAKEQANVASKKNREEKSRNYCGPVLEK